MNNNSKLKLGLDKKFCLDFEARYLTDFCQFVHRAVCEVIEKELR